jgi:preprotein translocase subunit SecF
MFQIFVGTNFKFMERRRIAYLFSAVLLLISIGSLIAHGGPKESIDFTGGTLLYLKFDREVPVGDIRQAGRDAGFDGLEVQMAEEGTQTILRFRTTEGSTANVYEQFQQKLQERVPGVSLELLSEDTVGPKIGGELEQKATLAIIWSLVLILIYIAWRFTRFSFGIGAVLALFHDILITLGVFSLLNREIDLTVVAAFLTIGGYSINDTIVVFDRIRENMGLARRLSFLQIVNRSVNQTLSRTLLTAGSTLLAVLALFFLGGTVIHDFALAMLVGIVIGTYSSIFVASALALDISNWWVRRRQAKEKSPARGKAKAAPAS